MNPENYNYLIIDTPEKKRHYRPKQKGDEVQGVMGHWCESRIDEPFWPKSNYRRPLVLPTDPEWELVPLDGVIKDWDEFYDLPTDQWIQTTYAGKLIRETPCVGEAILAYRRRKQKPVEQGDAVAELAALKTAIEDAKQVYSECKDDLDVLRYIETRVQVLLSPEPAKPASEIAFKKLMDEEFPLHQLMNFSNVMVWQHMQKAWNAALTWRNNQ